MLTQNDGFEERRKKPRIYKPFRVAVRSVNVEGEAFTSETVLDNLSAGGMYVRIPQHIRRGTKVFSVIQLLTESDQPSGTCVAFRGVASRADHGVHCCGLAVRFTRHRFL